MQFSYKSTPSIIQEPSNKRKVQAFNIERDGVLNDRKEKPREINGYVPFGMNDRTGEELIALYNGSSLHASILNMKANLAAGTRYEYDTDREISLLEIINSDQSAKEFFQDTFFQMSFFGQAYWQIHMDPTNTKVVAVRCLNSNQCRVNEDNSKVMWSESFYQRQPIKPYNQYSRTNPTNKMVMVLRSNRFNEHYSLPNYITAASDIKNDEALKGQIQSALHRGFMPKLKIVMNEEPDNKEEAAAIMNPIEEQLFGLQQDRNNALFVFGETNDIKIEEINIKNIDEQFKIYEQYTDKKIMQGHSVPSKALIGLSDGTGSLGNATELRNAYAIWLQSTIAPMREVVENAFIKILKLNGIWTSFEIQDDFLENLEENNKEEI